jgi:hypothetical protein
MLDALCTRRVHVSDGSEEQVMRVNLDPNGETPQDQEEPNLSRRSFLARLTILGVGCAAAMTLGGGKADATTEIDTATKAKDLAKDETAELVDGVDPDDPLQQFAQMMTPGERRRTRRRVRRTRRRVRRRYRRTRRRMRRQLRRTRRRVRRAVEFIVNWAVAA